MTPEPKPAPVSAWELAELERIRAGMRPPASSGRVFTPCYRCDGSGYIAAYRHVEAGVCFACRGRAR